MCWPVFLKKTKQKVLKRIRTLVIIILFCFFVFFSCSATGEEGFVIQRLGAVIEAAAI